MKSVARLSSAPSTFHCDAIPESSRIANKLIEIPVGCELIPFPIAVIVFPYPPVLEYILPAAAISASIGLALFPRDGENLEALMASADNAMYQIKKSRA